MENYVISCCSTADLSKEHFDAIDVKYICFHFELDGKQYEDNLGVSIPFDEFYSRMANGADTKTSRRRRYRRSSRIVRSMLLIPWRHLRDTVC